MAQPKKPTSKRVERSNDLAWWCPECGHANTWLIDTCGGCGAARDSDTLKAQDT